MGGGSYSAAITNNGTLNYGSAVAQTLRGVISGGGTLNQNGPGTLTLSGANTCTGVTSINAATLVLGAGGSLGASNIKIASGATFDVSSQAAYSIGGATLAASGNAAAAANINGQSGGTVSLGSSAVTLTYDGAAPALTIPQGTLVLKSNKFTINTTSGSPLSSGNYNLVQQSAGNITDQSGTYPAPRERPSVRAPPPPSQCRGVMWC